MLRGTILPAIIQQINNRTRELGHLDVGRSTGESCEVKDTNKNNIRHVVKIGSRESSAWPTKRWRGMAAVLPCRLLSLSPSSSLSLWPPRPDARLPILEAKPDPPSRPQLTLAAPSPDTAPSRPAAALSGCSLSPSHPVAAPPHSLPLLSLADTAPAAEHLSS